jgi:hypothetical protein
MFLLVQPNDKKHCRLKYRFAGKQNQISLGQYPAVSLKAAPQQREKQKANLAKGLNPAPSGEGSLREGRYGFR